MIQKVGKWLLITARSQSTEAKAYAEAVASLSKKGYFVIIKPHPSEQKNKYAALPDKNVIVSTFISFLNCLR